jgi:hypothetical protein
VTGTRAILHTHFYSFYFTARQFDSAHGLDIIKNKGTMKELLTLWKTDCQAEGFTAREYVYGFIGTLVLIIAVIVEGIINTL